MPFPFAKPRRVLRNARMNAEPPEALVHFLQSNALFGGLSDAQMPEVLALLRKENFAAGDIIVCEGESGDRMHFILSGSAEIVKDATPDIRDDDEPARIGALNPGDAFGEMGLIDTQPRSATIRALSPVETLSLSNRDLHKLYRSHPAIFTMIILNLARELSRRLRKMDEQAARRAGGGK